LFRNPFLAQILSQFDLPLPDFVLLAFHLEQNGNLTVSYFGKIETFGNETPAVE
jgi:hypothetical protein